MAMTLHGLRARPAGRCCGFGFSRFALWVAVLRSGLARVLELPAKLGSNGLFTVELRIGSPPQKVKVALDSASQALWVPSTGPQRFELPKSSSLSDTQLRQDMPAHGMRLDVVVVSDDIELDGTTAKGVSFFVVQNESKTHPPKAGILGLATPLLDGTALSSSGGALEPVVGVSFFGQFCERHPEVSLKYWLRLDSATSPRVLVGEAPSAETDVELLGDHFALASNLWYVPVRAVGLSMGQTSPMLLWNIDFNTFFHHGARVLLDSGGAMMRFDQPVFQELLAAMPVGCVRHEEDGIHCPCNGASIGEDFPSFSISFETEANRRILGIDFGDDTIVCVHPDAYVRLIEPGTCSVAVSDFGVLGFLGPGHINAAVFGAPFFRAVGVYADPVRRVLGLTGAGARGNGRGTCADPKNILSTGFRVSLPRTLLILAGFAMLALYVHAYHDPSIFWRGVRDKLGIPHSDALPPRTISPQSHVMGGMLWLQGADPGGFQPVQESAGGLGDAPGRERQRVVDAEEAAAAE